jgi:hypothetical protein
MRSTDAVSRLEGQSLGDEDAVTATKKMAWRSIRAPLPARGRSQAETSRELRVDFIWILRQTHNMARSLRVPEERNRNTLGSQHGWKTKECQRRFGWPTAFVAETYGWLAGRPAVCISALGPGAFNFCFISKACL